MLVDLFVKLRIYKIDVLYLETERSSSKLAIELGVGGGVALLVAIVLCVVGIAYYRRYMFVYYMQVVLLKLHVCTNTYVPSLQYRWYVHVTM